MGSRGIGFFRGLHSKLISSPKPLGSAHNLIPHASSLSSATAASEASLSATSSSPLRIWQRLLSSQASSEGKYPRAADTGHRHGMINLPSTLAPSAPYSTLRTGLWGSQNDDIAIVGLQRGSLCGAAGATQQQQVRNIMVDVTHDDLERAMRKMKRRLKDDGGIRLLRERQNFRKPSELKVLARKERDKRIAKKAFREKLKWIQNRRSRGF